MISVLLIEDNDVDARLTQDLLAEWSVEEFKVTHAKTLSDGLAYIDKGRFDAILLDLSLPDAFGLPTVRQVHATNPSIPVVVLSGVSDQSLALQAVQQGAQDYLVKGQGHPELLARSVRYAIERKRSEERLTYLAQYDQLTGLVNRTLFRDRLIQAMARSKRLQQPLGLMLLDLDRFKSVNDTLGHDVGDELLKAVALRPPLRWRGKLVRGGPLANVRRSFVLAGRFITRLQYSGRNRRFANRFANWNRAQLLARSFLEHVDARTFVNDDALRCGAGEAPRLTFDTGDFSSFVDDRGVVHDDSRRLYRMPKAVDFNERKQRRRQNDSWRG